MRESAEDCDHKYVHLETVKRTESGAYQIRWIRIERYYCERCLESCDVKKEHWSRERPEWY